MIRRPPRSTHCISSAASDVYKRQVHEFLLKSLECHVILSFLCIFFGSVAFIAAAFKSVVYMHLIFVLEFHLLCYARNSNTIGVLGFWGLFFLHISQPTRPC
eukprot:TRINITY_DN8675_c0_g3_i1.p1 TRINITY_DN8675_c0_g3~~TRINITY_DN8675_c0_g3_i1.p1  ORF type:complete len:109 (-),score=14.41 TRINITY_DN8675_c0_g3_i1:1-306(-)